jgi:uncharacterized protein (TIGR02246 family)
MMHIIDTSALAEVFAQLEQAWNEADAERFGEFFTDDADFVNVHGEHCRGVVPIVEGHNVIFDTVYKDSKVTYSVVQCEPISDGWLLGHVRTSLEVPAGPLQGRHTSIITVVAVETESGLKVRAFHNTFTKH